MLTIVPRESNRIPEFQWAVEEEKIQKYRPKQSPFCVKNADPVEKFIPQPIVSSVLNDGP